MNDEHGTEAILTGSEREQIESFLHSNRVEIAAAFSLDDLAMHNRRGPRSLRWIYLHLIEELARHAGHGDILREQILAAGGSPA